MNIHIFVIVASKIFLFLLIFILFQSSAPVLAQTVVSDLVINEIDYDQPSADTAEFIEIKNNATGIKNLDTYELRLINGSGGNALIYQIIDLPNVDLNSGDYFVVCSDAATVANCDLDVAAAFTIQNGDPDAVALFNGSGTSGTLVDTISYGGSTLGYTEGTGSVTDSSSLPLRGISRYPDGQDTNNNNFDFVLSCITPGEVNVNYQDCSNPPATSVCGNNNLETGEQCDGGICCNTDCTFKSSQNLCRAAGSVCDAEEFCNGTSSECPTDEYAQINTICDDGLYCDGAEVCDGYGLCQGGLPITCNNGTCSELEQKCILNPPVCGNGQIETGEECDDGNTGSQDGCSSTCQKELGSISGFVFYDIDKDNNWDGWKKWEFRLNNWRIFIDQNNNKKLDKGEQIQLSQGYDSKPLGNYVFSSLLPGSYNVCEMKLLWWKSSLPNNSNCQQIILGGGENKEDVNFGNHF